MTGPSRLKGKSTEGQGELKVKKQELAELKSELLEGASELNATQAVEIEMRSRLEENQKQLADNQKAPAAPEGGTKAVQARRLQELSRGLPEEGRLCCIKSPSRMREGGETPGGRRRRG